MKTYQTQIGKPYPQGCSGTAELRNFALFSSLASQVELCLFDEQGAESRLPMQRSEQHIWHLAIENLPAGTAYGFRLYPNTAQENAEQKNSEKNHRTFSPMLPNPQKLMLDPYAKGVQGKPECRNLQDWAMFSLQDPQDNAHVAPKALVIDEDFPWQETAPLRTDWGQSVIYELHVKGFTQLREDLPEHIRGTYAGLAHPNMLAYLQELGVTAVELLPVSYHLDEPHLQQKGLRNYWGYNPLAMFALETDYASNKHAPLQEFKQMVQSLHQAGIEVILDMVFNHSAEGERNFPTFSQRGIDESTYYWQWDNGDYINWTGCGNMLDLSKAQTRRWVVDCLRYWVESCHVDGFRFDLGTVLGREQPSFNPQAQLFADIMAEPSLQHIKLIAEPWDIGDYGYQLGHFPSQYPEWNDRFRDDMCRFWLWKSGELGAFAERLAGSSDIFKQGQNRPYKSLNFITAHDGFTLRDLVSYNYKHNQANGEDNRDGRNENYSYNHGYEGVEVEGTEQQKSAVFFSRIFSSKALLSSLLLANGVPMLLAGDEFGNSQWGNNNAYCQDNPIAWLKWQDFNSELFSHCQQMIALRKQIASLTQEQWWTAENVRWLNSAGEPMSVADWHNHANKALQILLDQQWLLLINAKAEPQIFSLPEGIWKMSSDIEGNNKNQQNQLAVHDLSFCVLHKIAQMDIQ